VVVPERYQDFIEFGHLAFKPNLFTFSIFLARFSPICVASRFSQGFSAAEHPVLRLRAQRSYGSMAVSGPRGIDRAKGINRDSPDSGRFGQGSRLWPA